MTSKALFIFLFPVLMVAQNLELTDDYTCPTCGGEGHALDVITVNNPDRWGNWHKVGEIKLKDYPKECGTCNGRGKLQSSTGDTARYLFKAGTLFRGDTTYFGNFSSLFEVTDELNNPRIQFFTRKNTDSTKVYVYVVGRKKPILINK